MKTPGHSVTLFLFLFSWFTYVHISVRKVEESGKFLISWLFTFIVFKVPSSSRYFRRKSSLRHQRGKLFYVLFHVWMCTLWGSSSWWFLTAVSAALSFPSLALLCTQDRRWHGHWPAGVLPIWPLIHCLFPSHSIPAWMSTSLTAPVCSAFHSWQLAQLGNGAAHFLIWPFIWEQILIGSRCDGSLCRAKSGCWQIEKFQEQKKKKFLDSSSVISPCSSSSSVKQCIAPHLVLLSMSWDESLFL